MRLAPWTLLAAAVALAGCRTQPLEEVQPVPGECGEEQLSGGCAFGRCVLSAARGAIPKGTTIAAHEVPLPPELASDAVGEILCEVTLPVGLMVATGLTLTVSIDADENAVLFRYAPPGPSSVVPTLAATRQSVSGLVSTSGRYGVTRRPTNPVLGGAFGADVSSSADLASLLRNVSRHPSDCAAWDGTHFFLGSRNRLLIYDGVPAPDTRPSVVLGQPDLDTDLNGTSSSIFDGGVTGIHSDGTRLAVATTHRILVWNRLPTQSFAPADLVLGQPDFSSDSPNLGGTSAATLSSPSAIDYDGTHFAVADTTNHRVLVWRGFPDSIDTPAAWVIGQPDFTSNSTVAGATPLNQPRGVLLLGGGAFIASYYFTGLMHVPGVEASNPAFDFRPLTVTQAVSPTVVGSAGGVVRTSSGGLAVRDNFGFRVAVYRDLPTGVAPMDFVLGQPDPGRSVPSPTSASSLVVTPNYFPSGLGGGSKLIVPDGTSRVLVYDQPPDYNFAPADRVVGQPGYTTNETGVDYRGISAATLAFPSSVAVRGDTLAVADRGNNRVLLYAVSQLDAGLPTAAVVVGQPDERTFVPNVDQIHPDARHLSGPSAVALDGAHLIVADAENQRVLVWNGVPGQSGVPADLVLGQADFSARRPSRGRGDTNPRDGYCDADADGFFYPSGVASDGTHLYVSDRLNHRVLVWRSFPTRNGQPADAVIGQASMTANLANRGKGPYTVVPDGLNLPTALALDGGDLWIADTDNNRVVRWSDPAGTPSPTQVLGQPDGSTLKNTNYGLPTDGAPGKALSPAPTAASVIRPRGITFGPGAIYIAESDSNRVHLFDRASFAPLGALGQTSDTSAAANAPGIGPAAISAPLGLASDGGTLFVADSANHRVLLFDVRSPPASGAAAVRWIGQPSPLTNGFNQASSASGSTTQQPEGLAFVDDKLYVADTGHHRVLVLAAPPTPGAKPLAVYGQPDDTLALPNAGGAPSARSMQSPRGLHADRTWLMVADTGNHRVLLFPRDGDGAAAHVLGHASFDDRTLRAADPSSLSGPQGVSSDGTHIAVADTGNHRVLLWNRIPEESGAPADVVLGQPDLRSADPNRGGSDADATTLAFPTSALFLDGALYVADSGNNRVLRFASLPSRNGAAADSVLGQPDLGSREAGRVRTQLDRLAGPVALASDGALLYVADRDLGRVVLYLLDGAGARPVSLVGGGVGGVSLSGPHGLAVQTVPLFGARLYVDDTRSDRVVRIDGVTRLETM